MNEPLFIQLNQEFKNVVTKHSSRYIDEPDYALTVALVLSRMTANVVSVLSTSEVERVMGNLISTLISQRTNLISESSTR